MQTEADQVMHALAGWPQCWACLDYQKPHRMRMAAMRKHNTDTCLCTPCRKTEVRCTRCYDIKARWAFMWAQTVVEQPASEWKAHLASVAPFAVHGSWEGFCTSCARHAQEGTTIQFYAYPAGTPKSVPRQRHVPYRRRSVTKRP